MAVLRQKIEERQTKACPRLTFVLLYIHIVHEIVVKMHSFTGTFCMA